MERKKVYENWLKILVMDYHLKLALKSAAVYRLVFELSSN